MPLRAHWHADEKNRPFAKAPAHIINALKRSGATITDVIGADGATATALFRPHARAR